MTSLKQAMSTLVSSLPLMLFVAAFVLASSCGLFHQTFKIDKFVTLDNPPQIWEQATIGERRFRNAVLGPIRGSLTVMERGWTDAGMFTGPYEVVISLDVPGEDWLGCSVMQASVKSTSRVDYSQYLTHDSVESDFRETRIHGVEYLSCHVVLGERVPLDFDGGDSIVVEVEFEARSLAGTITGRMRWTATPTVIHRREGRLVAMTSAIPALSTVRQKTRALWASVFAITPPHSPPTKLCLSRESPPATTKRRISSIPIRSR